MKYFLILIIFVSSAALGQENQSIYNKVVSLMMEDFNYDYEKEKNTIKVIDLNQSSQQNNAITEPPLVLLNGGAIKLESLKDYSADKIREIDTYFPGSKEASLYGSNGSRRGVINVILE